MNAERQSDPIEGFDQWAWLDDIREQLVRPAAVIEQQDELIQTLRSRISSLEEETEEQKLGEVNRRVVLETASLTEERDAATKEWGQWALGYRSLQSRLDRAEEGMKDSLDVVHGFYGRADHDTPEEKLAIIGEVLEAALAYPGSEHVHGYSRPGAGGQFTHSHTGGGEKHTHQGDESWYPMQIRSYVGGAPSAYPVSEEGEKE